MPHSPLVVANYFIEKARSRKQEFIDRAMEYPYEYKLQEYKLHIMMYYAYGWYTRISDEPLFEENPQCWVHGPAFPIIFRYFHTELAIECKPAKLEKTYQLPDELIEILERVWRLCGVRSFYPLKATSSAPGTPWYVMKYEKERLIIPHKMIQEHFKSNTDDIKLEMMCEIDKRNITDTMLKWYLIGGVANILPYKLEQNEH